MVPRKWINTALTYLVIIALIGTYMRLNFVLPLNAFNYEFILHSHSHVAILGWVYSSLFIALISSYLGYNSFKDKKYAIIFWLTQFSIIGMLFAFPVQGYAVVSISFSTLHILLSYVFIIFFIKDNKRNLANKFIHSSSLPFIYASLLFLFISSFGPWSLGFLASQKMIGSDIYRDAIYFYLHFQYNGWFTFAILGLITWLLEKAPIQFNKKIFRVSFWLLFISVFPAYLLSLSYDVLPNYLTNIAFAFGIIQLIGIVIYFIEILPNVIHLTIEKNYPIRLLLYFSLASLLLKYIFQAASGLNKTNYIIFINRDIVIGYIHLVMLGFITCSLLFWFASQNFLNLKNVLEKSGVILFLVALLVTELLLFSQTLIGIIDFSYIPYRLLLFVFSAIMLLGIILHWIPQLYAKDLRDT